MSLELERILSSETLSDNLAAADRNFRKVGDVLDDLDPEELNNQIYTIQTQTILENYLSAHNIPSTAKRGKLDVALKGMSSVNLFGTDGNCEDISKFKTGYGTPTLSLDAANKVYGSNALKLVTTVVGHGTGLSFKAQAGKYYMLSIYCKVTTGILQHTVFDMSNNVQISGGVSISSANMVRTVRKLAVTANSADVRWLWKQQDTTAMTAYIDGVMVNEISSDEYNNLTADELMAKYPYFEGLQGSSNIQVLSTGKNIANLDINKAYRREGQTSPNISLKDSTFTISGATAAGRFIAFNYRVAKGRQYTVSFNKNNADIGFKAYSTKPSYWNGYGISLANGTIITASEEWLQIYFEVAEGQIGTVSNFQLEEGTTATTYEPYKSTQNTYKTLDGQPITLHRVPNGVYDEILRDGRNVKRTKEILINDSDIGLMTSTSNLDFVTIKKPTDYSGYNTYQSSNNVLMPNFSDKGYADSVENIGKISGNYSQTNFLLGVTKGTYANVGAAQTALKNTPFIYELKQPQILETNAVPLLAEPNGHVFISADGCMPSNELSYPLNLGAVVDGVLNGQKEHSVLLDALYIDKVDRTEITNYRTPSDLPNAYKLGLAVFSTNMAEWLAIVNGAQLATVRTFMVNASAIYQEITAYGSSYANVKKFRVANSSNVWGAWQEIVTTTPKDWLNATLQNGWGGEIQYTKDALGRVTIRGGLSTIGTTVAATIVTNIPSGYRPRNILPILAHKGNVSPYDASPWFSIVNNGNLEISRNQTFPSTGTTSAAVTFEISYIAIS